MAKIVRSLDQLNIDAAKYNEVGTFTEAQRIPFVTEDNSIAFDSGNNIWVDATATTISVTNQTVGQSGTLLIGNADNITGWGTQFAWGNQGVPIDLSGTETFGYTIINSDGGGGTIKIGRM